MKKTLMAKSSKETKDSLLENDDDFKIYLKFKKMHEQEKSLKLQDEKIVILSVITKFVIFISYIYALNIIRISFVN